MTLSKLTSFWLKANVFGIASFTEGSYEVQLMGRQYHNIEREMTFEERNEYIVIFSRIHLRKQAQYDWVMGLVDRLNLDTVRHILSMEQLEHVPLFISVIY